jgi:16S rRNA (adenine1518-N6/adenine1519-N6)-dimethyltransferase
MRPRANKRLGQHFLHDPRVVAKIIAAIAPQRDDRIVEIGGGRGALTFPLAELVDSLDVIEIDDRLAARLESSPAGGKLTIHRADALDFDFASLANGPASLRIVGNLPYNVSTPLLFRLLAFRTALCDMHLMLQKEVVDRMAARPGTKQYGRLTVMLSPWLEVESCFDIGPGAFEPPPKVWSSLARLVVRREPRFDIGNEIAFAQLVSHLFSMRRKTLARSLRGLLTESGIEALDIDPRARPETLLPAEFAKLARAVRRQSASV